MKSCILCLLFALAKTDAAAAFVQPYQGARVVGACTTHLNVASSLHDKDMPPATAFVTAPETTQSSSSSSSFTTKKNSALVGAPMCDMVPLDVRPRLVKRVLVQTARQSGQAVVRRLASRGLAMTQPIQSWFRRAQRQEPTILSDEETDTDGRLEVVLSSLASHEGATAEQRKIIPQPLPPEQAEALALKYQAIESLEERAYTILQDLGMVEPSLDFSI